MSTPAARAEARRQAILKRGSDRLAKLTNTARGEDAAILHDDPPIPPLPSAPGVNLANFIGEESAPPPSVRRRPAPDAHASPFDALGLGGAPPDPSVWSEQQQQQLMQALMGGTASAGRPGASTPQDNPLAALMSAMGGGGLPPGGGPGPTSNNAAGPSPDDPLMALMSSLSAGAPPPGAAASAPTTVKPKSLAQKLLPVFHILSVWTLVAYFVLWKEPGEFYGRVSSAELPGGLWRRWADLRSRQAIENAWGVQVVPFFWAFISLELALHSFRIFSGLVSPHPMKKSLPNRPAQDAIQPPMLLMLALPHLPKPLPFVIMTALKYFQMAGAIFDDLAAAIVAFGLFVALAGFLAT
ncbi:hypothetical protein FA95DRAFT_1583899 [Auriscalpium vulgare]|uniref:Uncharacterized protein n=1 Tax=Auriscalpium vulgare TaxID=40419 RepID=A0ACB8RJ42_9AGAM|nr:hypothetical protein FA95DRAFT_1583899 [Auriscalpium vulgare]